jgi:hypothetical protein
MSPQKLKKILHKLHNFKPGRQVNYNLTLARKWKLTSYCIL